VEKFCLLKGFGAFDVVFIYSAKNFDSILTKHGPIDGILKTSRSFCFQYNKIHDRDIFKDLKTYPLSTISLVKLNPYTANSLPYNNEIEILKTIKEDDKTRKYALGTLGWNEMVVITAGNNFNDVMLQGFWALNSKKKDKILKTYSFIAINSEELLGINFNQSFESIKAFLDSHNSLSESISDSIHASIQITLNPVNTSAIESHWKENGDFSTTHFVGKEDLVVRPAHPMSWSHILSRLLRFRKIFGHSIVSTSTRIATTFDLKTEDLGILPDYKLNDINYDYKILEKLFFDEAHILANTYNTFRGLAQNVTIRDAFSDMLQYPAYIQSYADNINEETKRRNFAILTSEYLKRGAELRLYGTHGTIDEAVGQFTRLRGGAQRSLVALGFLPSVLINKHTPFRWRGFITTGAPLFYNFREIINVPPNALWEIDSWWGLYHEVAHLIIEKIPDLINEQVKELKPFLCLKKNQSDWLDLLTEMAAEYLGYAMGFYNNYDLFLKKLWGYLSKLSPQETLPAQLQFYAVRSFFVYLVDRLLIETSSADEIRINDLDWIYSEICNHIEAIADICTDRMADIRSFYDDKCYIAANYASIFRELHPWLIKKFIPLIKTLEFQDNSDHLKDRSTLKALEVILDGKMHEKKLPFPQGVLYKVLEKYDGAEIPFNVSMAVILTFWNNNKQVEARYNV